MDTGKGLQITSGTFAANAAWAVLAAIAHNLARAAGTLAGLPTPERPGQTAPQLINVPGPDRPAARRLTLHLPDGWPWERPGPAARRRRRSPRRPDHRPPGPRPEEPE